MLPAYKKTFTLLDLSPSCQLHHFGRNAIMLWAFGQSLKQQWPKFEEAQEISLLLWTHDFSRSNISVNMHIIIQAMNLHGENLEIYGLMGQKVCSSRSNSSKNWLCMRLDMNFTRGVQWMHRFLLNSLSMAPT